MYVYPSAYRNLYLPECVCASIHIISIIRVTTVVVQNWFRTSWMHLYHATRIRRNPFEPMIRVMT